jgi:hypothetical protein
LIWLAGSFLRTTTAFKMTQTNDANSKHDDPGTSPTHTGQSEGHTVDKRVQRSGDDQDGYSDNPPNAGLAFSKLGRTLVGSVSKVDAACDKVLSLGSTGIVRMAIVIATVLGALIALMTFIQVIADLSSLREDRAARRDEAIQKAWERLITPSAGNIGKGAALNVLFNNGVSLLNADFSCDVVGVWDSASSTCLRRPIFDSVRFAARPNYSSSAWPFNSLEAIANAITGIDDTPPSEEFGAHLDVQFGDHFATVIGRYGVPSPGAVKLAASGLACGA